MRFVYVYRTSEGARLTDVIESASRDDAFAALRKVGIRPIKVFAENGSKANGEMRGVRRRVVVAGAILGVFCGGVLATCFLKSAAPTRPANAAEPMTRRAVAIAVNKVAFADPFEVVLARYAIPGRVVEEVGTEDVRVADLEKMLGAPILLDKFDAPEVVDLKRIVAGMKEELRMFLASGGTIPEYLVRLEERQKMEISYREQAALHLAELAKTASEEEVFAEWKKQNAWLQAMGIERLEMPQEKFEEKDERGLTPETEI